MDASKRRLVLAQALVHDLAEQIVLLAEIEATGGQVSVVAQRHGIAKSLLYNWRSAWKAAALAARGAAPRSADRNIDISRRDLNRVADAAGHLSRELARPEGQPPIRQHRKRQYRAELRKDHRLAHCRRGRLARDTNDGASALSRTAFRSAADPRLAPSSFPI